jgi:hypothetical protein
MQKKRSKICICFRVSKAKFYLYHSSKIAKAGPGFDDHLEHPPVLISSSSTIHKKRPKICTRCRFSKAKFYLYHSTKIAKAGPGFDEIP